MAEVSALGGGVAQRERCVCGRGGLAGDAGEGADREVLSAAGGAGEGVS